MDDYKSDSMAQQATLMSGIIGAAVIIVNLLMAAIIMLAIWLNAGSVLTGIFGIIGGVFYYSTATPFMLFVVTGGMAQYLTKREEELTTRGRHKMEYAQRVTVEHPIQLPYTDHTPPLALPRASTFVPAQAEPDDSAKREAAAWVLQLYGQNGQPDPKKVLLTSDKERPGRVRIAAPSRPAKQWLLDRHIIHDLGNGFRLSLTRVPTISAAQEQLR